MAHWVFLDSQATSFLLLLDEVPQVGDVVAITKENFVSAKDYLTDPITVGLQWEITSVRLKEATKNDGPVCICNVKECPLK